jgi:hypothetical protein
MRSCRRGSPLPNRPWRIDARNALAIISGVLPGLRARMDVRGGMVRIV